MARALRQDLVLREFPYDHWRLTTSSFLVLFRKEYSAIHSEVCNLGASLDLLLKFC